ncbi:MAG TPA: hypothetical protein VKA73_17090 [Rubrobacter sp.]|nr:hypothetical protein [Rubrobacter sp.]
MAEEVREILLTNPAIAGEEPGRVVFALRGSRDDPDEFWILASLSRDIGIGSGRSWTAVASSGAPRNRSP